MATWTCAGVDYDSVNYYAGNGAGSGSVQDGDTVVIPAGSATWANQLNITKKITLRGSNVVLGTLNGKQDIPLSCGTVITDGFATSAGSIIVLVVPADSVGTVPTQRICGIEFRDGGNRGSSADYVIYISGDSGASQDKRRFRIDHCRFDKVVAWTPFVYCCWGLLDHNYVNVKTGNVQWTYFTQPNAPAYSNRRWHEAANWGTDEFLFFEDNVIDKTGTDWYAAIDQYAGAKTVTRYNWMHRQWVEAHGTETSNRGTRAVECYGNTIVGDNSNPGAGLVGLRAGPSLAWGNSLTDMDITIPIITCNNDPALGGDPFDNHGGYSVWDVNDASNPYGSFTATSYTTPNGQNDQTVTVSGAGWTTNQWAGYHIHKTNFLPLAATDLTGSVVQSNTSDTLTIHVVFSSFYLIFDASHGFDFTLNKTTHVHDQCGRGQDGTELVESPFITITRSGTTAQATTNPAHGLTTGDYVNILNASPFNYNGTWQITVTGSTTFTYTMGADPGVDASNPSWRKAPASNDQVTEGVYAWLNNDDGVAANSVDPHFGILDFIQDVHRFQYGGIEQTTSTSPFNGSTGIGVGPISKRPDAATNNLTIGVGYWATDEQKLYRATGVHTWTLYYQPYTYPHPFAINDFGSGRKAKIHWIKRSKGF